MSSKCLTTKLGIGTCFNFCQINISSNIYKNPVREPWK